MNSEQKKRAIKLIKEVDRLQSKGIIELVEMGDNEDDFSHQDLCDLSYDLHQLLQAELDRQENKPLTLSELKEMVEEPVYYVSSWEDEEDNYHEEGWTVLMQVKEGRVKFSSLNGDISLLHVGIDDIVFYKHKPTEGVGK